MFNTEILASIRFGNIYFIACMFFNNYTLIGKEDPMQQHPVTITTLPLNRSFGTFKRDFQLSDACGFITNGLQVGYVIV